MTPIRPSLLSINEDNVCLAQPVEELVCRSETPPPPATTSLPDIRALAHQRYTQSLLLRNRTALASNSPLSSSTPLASNSSIFNSSPLAMSGFTFVGAALPMACGTHDPLDDDPPPGDDPIDDPSDDENPPVNTGGDDGGLGAGILTSFAASDCAKPVDLDIASDTSSLLMTCSDTEGAGNAILERINASTGAVEALLLPDTLENEPTKAVHLTSAAGSGTGVVHVGFAPTGTDAQFISGARSLGNSGIFITPENDANATSHVLFNPFQIRYDGSILPISLAGVNGTDATVNSFTPNTPVSMVRLGNQLFSLTQNRVVNHMGTTSASDDTMDFAPATILRYGVSSSGALSATPIGSAGLGNVIAGSSDPHNAYFMDGVYNPTAIGATEDGRLVVVSQGIPGANASSIHVFNPDFTSGLTDGAGSSEIVLNDSANPDFDFVVNNSSQVTLVGNTAIVGSFDGSGRIAIVDVSAAGPSGGASRIRYVKVYDNGSDIANIVANPSGQYAYVISDTGHIRTVTLTAGDNFGKVGNDYSLASGLMSGTTIPALFRANAVIAARPNGYSKAPIN